MITLHQKIKILEVVNVFETGSKEGKYVALVVYPDGKNGTRQVTYGRSQTTEQGNLKAMLELYVAKNGLFKVEMSVFIAKIGHEPLADNDDFKKLLRRTAREDLIMHTAQDEFFEILYFQPAKQFFEANKFTMALSMLVIYDSYIHSGSIKAKLRERFPENVPLNGGNEKTWIKQYVTVRATWLKSNKLLAKTAYRTDCFLKQISIENWDLVEPIDANDVII